MTRSPLSSLPVFLSLALCASSAALIFSSNQTSGCADGRVCFSLGVDLPIEPEGDREGYKRPSNTRYQAQEREIYYQLRMDQTPTHALQSGAWQS